ncbi:exocyst complex component EXO70H1-like [Miscanthus floridulus]|uniref:exocyst complex component EXO70H1-like n=1 Tax=Miscanthus floridulus TaxID=154761 RepID=UPI00345AE449
MASAWWGAWRRRVSSSTKRRSDLVLPIFRPNERPTQHNLADYHSYNNCGISTTASGTTTTMSNTYTASTTASLPVALPGATAGGEGVTDNNQEKMKMREHIKDLIHEFRGAATSDALGRWLSELQVSWVLHLTQLDASAGKAFVSRLLQYTARSWILALHAINSSIVSFNGWCSSQDQEEDEAVAVLWPPTSELVGFVAATFLQMLPFVDVVVALEVANPACGDDHGGKGGAVASAHKFQTLTDVREALSGVSEQVQLWNLWLCYSRDAEATRISGEMNSLLLAKLDKLDVAIRETRDHIRTQFMSLTHHHGTTWDVSWLDPSSLGIHKATRSIVGYIVVLSTSYDRSVDPPNVHVHEEWFRRGKDVVVRGDEHTSSSILIILMIRYLEEQLAKVSRSFPDQSLRFLFLLNNFYFVRKQLRTNRILDVPMYALTRKIDGYIDSYLRVSWTPVLKPLHNHYSPCCFTRYSAQHKFETKFDKTYTAQKLWKVPDPELREELRTAIIERVISSVTMFLEDKGISASGSTPKKLEQMLEELFEG